MTTRTWLRWVGVLLAIHVAASLGGWLLARAGLWTAVTYITPLALIAQFGVIIWGLRQASFDAKVQWTALIFFGMLAAFASGLLFLAGNLPMAIVPIGIWVLLTAFFLGIAMLRFLLSGSSPTIAVARVVLDEAIRLRVALICIFLLVLWIPIIPLRLDPAEMLNYRVQFLLSSTLNATAWILGIMTVVIACATINREIDLKQIQLTLTKPIGRLQYLAGKWLGIMLINLLLVSVSGAGIYILARMMEKTPALNERDRAILETEVLTAREVSKPDYPGEGGLIKAVADRIAELRRVGREGFTSDPIDSAAVEQARAEVLTQWYHLKLMGVNSADERRTYVFTGLSHSNDPYDHVELHIKVEAAGRLQTDTIQLGMAVNGTDFSVYVPPILPDAVQSIRIPSSFVDKDGRIVLEVWAPRPADIEPDVARSIDIGFKPEDGLEVRHVVGSFEGNLTRGLIIIWLKLGFLAALGLTLSTFMAFPVAVLGTLLVFAASEMSVFLWEALQYYIQVIPGTGSARDEFINGSIQLWGYITSGDVGSGLRMIIKLIGEAFVLCVPSFGEYPVVDRLSDGRVITWHEVGAAAVRIGVLWTMLCGAVGWFVFRRRELARVTV